MSLFKNKKGETYNSYIKSRLLDENSPFIIAEAYKTTRTNLMFMLSGKKKTIAFTSSLPGEGKTTTCLNLAISFAQSGSKVIIIDMDMRKPRVHRYFEIPSSPGLSDLLEGFTQDIPVSKTKYKNLSVLPVGTVSQNSPELLMSSAFDDILDSLRNDFDYIFIDTPPVNVVTDIAVIASKLDGVVFVVRENMVPLEIVRQSIESLQRVGARLLGFIMSDSSLTQYKYKRKTRYGYSYEYSLPKKEK